MKQAAYLLTMVAIASAASLASGQTVSGRAPIVVPAQYVSSSSPMTDGRVVTSVYTSGSNQRVSSVSEPYRVSKGDRFQHATPGSSNWQTVASGYADASTVTLQSQSGYATPTNSVPPTTSRIPVAMPAAPTTVYSPQSAGSQAYYVPVGTPTTVYSAAPNCACQADQPPVVQAPALPFATAAANYPQHTIYKPVVPLRRTIDGAYVSRGIWGQPKAYVPREPIRNFFRYVLP